MPASNFATFLIICPTSFFLGIIFNNWAYDTHTLWEAAAPADHILTLIETHYSTLLLAPPFISRILHCVCATGILGFLIKLWKPSESNMLFDGASLVLYVIGIVMYGTNMIRGLRTIEAKAYSTEVPRVDTLRVVAATQVILALVMVGVLVLQSGQWYAESKQEKEMEVFRKEDEAEAKREVEAARGGKGSKKRN